MSLTNNRQTSTTHNIITMIRTNVFVEYFQTRAGATVELLAAASVCSNWRRVGARETATSDKLTR